jgi:hypothetical protein
MSDINYIRGNKMGTKLSVVFAFAITCFLFSGCENELGGFSLDEQTISFETFNVRLGEELPLLSERTEKLERILKTADSDILCLQEIYDENEIMKISQFLKDKKNDLGYISTVYVNTKNEDFDPIPPSCTQEEVAPVVMCVAMECGGTDIACIAQNCLGDILALPPVCQQCLIGDGLGSIAGGDFQAVLEECMVEKEVVYKNNGNNGILLASKYPLKNKGTLALTSYGNHRMAVYATLGRIEKDGEIYDYKPAIGDTQIICTALSAIIDEEYDGIAGSWQQEQLTQINEILSIPDNENIAQRVIMGDFNSNIAGGENIIESNPAPVAALISDGWYDPYFDVEEEDIIQCTVCPENPFISKNSFEAVHDHIFFRNRKGFVFMSERVFHNEFLLFNEKEKTKTRYSISDHYGIRTVMTVDPNF